jgi:hypothetical protein
MDGGSVSLLTRPALATETKISFGSERCGIALIDGL